MKSNNIIIAGVPRSGSTLTCHLLNKTPNIVALHEPMEPSLFFSSTEVETVTCINNFFAEQRDSIAKQGVAKSKSLQGKVPDNQIGGVDEKTGKRIWILDGNQIDINKDLSDNFLLAIKQPGLFSSMLSFLSDSFSCYATIRNPLAVLRSWNSVDMAVADGHAPAAEQHDAVLKVALAGEKDVFQRQLILLSWYFEQFYKYLPSKNIIRYEDVIITSGQNLSCITPEVKNLEEKLETRNNNPLYDESLKQKLNDLLLDSDGYYWNYYSKEGLNNV